MARDERLEQLKVAQDSAFNRKQEAYQEQRRSWDILSEAKDKMNRAFEAKQDAHNDQERAWQHYRSISDSNGPRIEYLNSAQETAFQNMKNAFDRASSAHDNHDGASAKAYSIEGHGYKAEAQGYVEERRRLVNECKRAKEQHEPLKRIFEEAKLVFGRAKDDFDSAKSAHEKANSELKKAKAEYDSAVRAFQARLSELKAENAKKRDSDRMEAFRAGVPYQYLESVKVRRSDNGITNFYFGGLGEKDGLLHGHIAIDSSGKVTYRRMPLENHGSQNFTGANGIFNGQPAKIVTSDADNSDRIDVYYGGHGEPDGPGHSHVSVIKDSIRFWRENGIIIIDERTGVQ